MPYSLRIVSGFFNVPQLFVNRCCETGPLASSPYPRRLKSLTICWCNYKGSTFYSVILRPWMIVRLELKESVMVWPESNSRPPAWQPDAQPTDPPVKLHCSSLQFWIWLRKPHDKIIGFTVSTGWILICTSVNVKLETIAIARVSQVVWLNFDTILVRLVWIVHIKVYLSSKGNHSLINAYLSTWCPDVWKVVDDNIVNSCQFVDWVVACMSPGKVVIVSQMKSVKMFKDLSLDFNCGKKGSR